MADTTSTISRKNLEFPDLGYSGGSGLETLVKALFETLGDQLGTRYQEYTSIANSATVELDHNLGVAVEELKILLYSGTGTNLTRIPDPVAAGWTIAAKSGSEKLIIEITAPSSGGPHDFTAIINHGAIEPWNTVSKSSAYNAKHRDEILADTSGGAFTATLPASPLLGHRVSIIDATDSFGTNSLTVGRNGNNIQGAAADLTLSTNGQTVELVFDGTNDWRIK